MNNTTTTTKTQQKRTPHYIKLAANKKSPSAGTNGAHSPALSREESGNHIDQGGNLGHPLGKATGLIVFDADVKENAHSVAQIEQYFDAHGVSLDQLIVVNTPSGGRHYYFSHPDEKIPSLNEAQFLKVLGVAVKSDGFYVVVPPSIVKDVMYEYLGELNLTDIPLVLPKSIIADILACKPIREKVTQLDKNKRYHEDEENLKNAINYLCGTIRNNNWQDIKEGSRNSALFQMAAIHRDFAISIQTWTKILRTEWYDKQTNKLSEDEFMQTIKSAEKSASNVWGAKIVDINKKPKNKSLNEDYIAGLIFEELKEDLVFNTSTEELLCFCEEDHIYESLKEAPKAFYDALQKVSNDIRAIKNPENETAYIFLNALNNRTKINNLKALLLEHVRRNQWNYKEKDQFNASVFHFSAANGVIDLRTAEIVPLSVARSLFFTTKSRAAYYPERRRPIELIKLLNRQYEEYSQEYEYHQLLFGSYLTGILNDKLFHVFCGSRDSGKSGLITCFEVVLNGKGGRVASGENPRIFFGHDDEQRCRLFYRIRDCRFVGMSEAASEGSIQISSDILKGITGGDPQTSHKLHNDPFTFRPLARYALFCNEPPVINGEDDGAKARLRPIQWSVPIPKEERYQGALYDLYEAEKEDILGWLVEGAKRYLTVYHGRLPTVQGFEEQKKEVLRETAAVENFLEEEVLEVKGVDTTKKALYTAYLDWIKAKTFKATALSQNKFSRKVRDLGKESRDSGRGEWWIDLQIRSDFEAEQAPNNWD